MRLIRSGKNLITSYGLFWDLDETEWLYRDRGKRRGRLLGRLRKKGAGLWLHSADFWSQSGIYVLYGNYGPYYVGVSKELGKRIHDHVRDQHTGKWDRFSWFGFREVLADRDADSFLRLGKAERYATVKLSKARADIEAILFRAFQGSGNSKN